MGVKSVRWYLEFLLGLIRAALKHLRDGPQLAAAQEQERRILGAIAELDQEDAERAEKAAKPKSNGKAKGEAEETA